MKREYSVEELRIIQKCRNARRKYIMMGMLALASALFAVCYSVTLWFALIGRIEPTAKVIFGALFYGGAVSYITCYFLVVGPSRRKNFLHLRSQTDAIERVHRSSLETKSSP